MPTTLGVNTRVEHPELGPGVITRVHVRAYDVCYVEHGVRQVGHTYADWTVVDAVEREEPVTFDAAERALLKILRAYEGVAEPVALGGKWDGGALILRPGEPGLKDKEMPIDGFFHKIVMVRDRLRTLEQRINASSLTDEEKVNLQQYVTRVYGSLTSFNALFARREDGFKGTGS